MVSVSVCTLGLGDMNNLCHGIIIIMRVSITIINIITISFDLTVTVLQGFKISKIIILVLQN